MVGAAKVAKATSRTPKTFPGLTSECVQQDLLVGLVWPKIFCPCAVGLMVYVFQECQLTKCVCVGRGRRDDHTSLGRRINVPFHP